MTGAGYPLNGMDVSQRGSPILGEMEGNGNLDNFIGNEFGVILKSTATNQTAIQSDDADSSH